MTCRRPPDHPAGQRSRWWSLTLLLALVVSACGQRLEPTHTVVDLLAITPPAIPWEGSVPPALQPRTWGFTEGIPEGWTVGPDGVGVSRDAGGLHLDAVGQPPWLEIELTIDPLRHHRMTVTTDESLSGNSGQLYYSEDYPPRYRIEQRAISRPHSPAVPGVHVFDLPGHQALEQRIRILRIYPPNRGGSTVIRSISLEPRDEDYLRRSVLSRHRLGLGQEYRRCWRFGAGGVREAALTIPADAVELHFGSGTLVGERPASLRVELLPQGGRTETLARVDCGPPGAPWEDHRVDISPWRGRQVTLRFITEPADASSLRLVGSPRIMAHGPDRRQNVLLIVVDTLRADRLSPYGCATGRTPCLSRLAREGILFSRAIAPSSWTIPSMAALFTGYYPHRLGVQWDLLGGKSRIPAGVSTITEDFAAAGYVTAGFVANYVLAPEQGYGRGFDSYYLAPYKDHSVTAETLGRRALDWLRDRGDQRVFCYMHYMDPHSPYDAPGPDGLTRWGRRPFVPDQMPGWRDGNVWGLTVGREQVEDEEDVREIGRFYEDEVAYLDRQLGRLLVRLEREGLLEDTVVLVTADHGEELHDHGFWSHGFTLYEEVVNVPLLLRVPGLRHRAGSVVHTPVSLVDIRPTLLALAGLPAGPAVRDGENLLGPGPQRLVFSRTLADAPARSSVFSGPWKYIHFDRPLAVAEPPVTAPGKWLMDHGPAEEELFHLDADPAERENLAESLPDVRAQLKTALHQWLAEARPAEARHGGEDTPEADTDMAERLRALGYIQ